MYSFIGTAISSDLLKQQDVFLAKCVHLFNLEETPQILLRFVIWYATIAHIQRDNSDKKDKEDPHSDLSAFIDLQSLKITTTERFYLYNISFCRRRSFSLRPPHQRSHFTFSVMKLDDKM
jgi:hypothetical protein